MKTAPHSIDEILRKNTSFFIPPFQRAYAWGKNEIERYFSDVIRIIRSELDPEQKDKLEHFFGTLVIKEETAGFDLRYIIVDGQQRLTTSLLFLIALRDSTDSEKQKVRINTNYLTNSGSEFPDKIKLKQVTKDWDSYRALIKGEEAQPGIIKNAYETFKKLIEDKKIANPEITPENYIQAIRRMNVAVIFLDERPFKGEDPQIIFETLNSLGKLLTLSDLIRNYVLLNMNSKNQTLTYESIWYPKIEKPLGEDTSSFFRDFLQYKTSSSIKAISDNNTKEVYAEFKDFVEDSYLSHKTFVDDLVQYVVPYTWIIREEVYDRISANDSNDKEIKELLRNIFHDIKTEAFKPFVTGLLFYYHYQDSVTKIPFADDALIDILKTIRTYLIRRRLLNLTQGENKSIVLLSDRMADLVQSKIDMPHLLSNLYYKMRFPNDDEICKVLEDANFYDDFKNYRKFILGKIEEHNTKVAVDFRNPKITIEHVMPQTLSPIWEKSLGDNFENIHTKYIHNIGNLILTEFNSEIGNDSFDAKKKKLATSSLFYRLDVINAGSWGETEIKRHQEKMINWFLETFPIPDQCRHTSNWNTKFQEKMDFSPLGNEAWAMAEGNKPSFIKLGDKEIKVSYWKDVYLEFLRFIKDSGSYDFQIVLDNQSELLGRGDAIIPWSVFEKKVELDGTMRGKYNTIDGLPWDKVVNLTAETLFFHVNFNTHALIDKVANVMNKFCIPEDYVNIMLK